MDALRQFGGEFAPVLCGSRPLIEQSLADECGDSDRESVSCVEIEHCPDDIAPSDAPAQAWKHRHRAAIVRCIGLQREGRVDASVGAGDTGVLMAAAIFMLGRTEGAKRPALAVSMPTTAGRHVVLLDVGANVNCRADHLVSFGLMGRDYVKRIFGAAEPRVALLNVGSERSKGTPAVSQADSRLREVCPEYTGYIEGSRIFSGDADVVVCDGFVGNALLKMCESFYALTESVLADSPEILGTVKKTMAVLDAGSYGAVPMLGIRGIVLKAHGNSSSRAIANAVAATLTVVRHGGHVVGQEAARGVEHSHA
jgi:glycerol-3-phosphate acyltransferase PlsX